MITGVTAVLVGLLAQTAGPGVVPAPHLSIVAGTTWDASRFAFRFDNPSRFDTTTLVPHSFEQRYRRPHLALILDARYGAPSRTASTSIRLGARQTIRASDIDTFLQPDGDIATSGTDGPVRLRALAIRQTLPAGVTGAWRLSAAVTYTRDTADFQPDVRVVTHSQPPSETRTFITDQEHTRAQTVRIGMDAGRDRRTGAWMQTVTVRVDPVVAARLLVQLPQKYPGLDLTFAAIGSGAGAGWAVSRRVGAATIGLWLDADVTWHYRQSSAYASHAVRLTGVVGR